ncbi:MAG TPA: prolyl oligopeptidase family serine peptidase [Thermoanaerobaculia bacterium]|nr:prolyl oligopeptidase family serine peptidase [Thermoanaerobaculia bacterium]
MNELSGGRPMLVCARAMMALTLLLLPLRGSAAETRFELSVPSIMRGHGLVGHPPRNVRWSGDGKQVFFEWKEATEPLDEEFSTWVVGRDGKGLRRLTDEEAKHAPPTRGEESSDRKRRVYADEGEIFIYDSASGRRRQITRTTDRESEPRFTGDGEGITFIRGNDLFLLSLSDGSITQLTDILASGEKPTPAWRDDEKKTEAQEYLAEEQRKLIGFIERKAKKEQEEKDEYRLANPRKPFELKSGQEINSLQLTPDGKYVIAFIRARDAKARNTIVPNYVTLSAYTEDIDARTNVGDGGPSARIASLDVATGKVQWLEHGLKAEERARTEKEEGSITPVTDEKAAGQEQEVEDAAEAQTTESVEEPVERGVAFGDLVFSHDGTRAVLHIESADNKDRWIIALDPATGKPRVLAHQHDDAWIGWLGQWVLGFLGDNETVYYLSEETGYNHLRIVPWNGGASRALTSGDWEVLDASLSEDRRFFHLTTNEGSPFEVHLYRMPVGGGAREKLTSMTGSNEAVVSPDGAMIANIHSFSNRPPELYLQRNRPGAESIRVTSSPLDEFARYPWIDPPIVHFRASDGVAVPARLYKPADWQTGGPAVIFVHGAGYLQNVHRWWSSYFREYMFHHLLMERGAMVLDIDYRGSSGYGRDWRVAIYRHMGGRDLQDQIDGARWLVAEHGVDPKRIGIYGGSYGGFITFMALFTEPDVFAAGAALRPVTDWAHYNHPYTSNILNAPQKDQEAYERSSPIYFAEGLEGALLICHGMVDVNVHFQDSVRLVQRLIELGKENWEMAVYPVEDHAFVQPSSWTDEYRRILKLFDENLGLGKE